MKYPTVRIARTELRTALLGAAVCLLAACSGGDDSDPITDLSDQDPPSDGGAGGEGGMNMMGMSGSDMTGNETPDCTADPTAVGCDPVIEDIIPPEVGAAGAGEGDALRQGFLNTFSQYCGDCHGSAAVAAGTVQGPIDYIDDFDALVAAGQLTPGYSEDSPILRRFRDGTMPPASYTGPRASEDEIDQVYAYIDNPFIFPRNKVDCTDQEVVPYDELFEKIQTDLILQDADDRPFIRYLTLTNRYNAGACAVDELDPERWAMNKLVNMLSTETRIRTPFPIDSDQLIYRIDIRHYGWDEVLAVDGVTIDVTDVNNVDATIEAANLNLVDALDALVLTTVGNGWDAIVQASTYGVPFDGDEAAVVVQQTQSRVPVISADAFLEVAAVDDLYYALIGVQGGENYEDFLLRDMGITILDIAQATIDVGADDAEAAVIKALVDDDVIRAGTTDSQISNQDRVTERRDLNTRRGAVYQSFDFEANDGLNESIFNDPFDFAAGGVEAVYTLPNNLLGFLIADANGELVGESNILIDTTQNDFKARTSVSCAGCHAAGFIPVVDQVRGVTEGQLIGGLNADQREGVLDIYVDSGTFANFVEFDSNQYQDSLRQTGVPLTVADPVSGNFIRFDRDMKLDDVAGELGLSPQLLLENLVLLDPQLGVLRAASVDRDDFSALFLDSLCRIQAASQTRPADVFCAALLAL